MYAHIVAQDIRDLVLHIVADAPPLGWVRIEVITFFAFSFTILTPPLESSFNPEGYNSSHSRFDT